MIRTKINVSSLMFCFTGSSKSFMTNIKQYQNIPCMLSLLELFQNISLI